jgi:hypothetical protein
MTLPFSEARPGEGLALGPFQHGQAVVVLVALAQPEGALLQALLDRRPQPTVA